jgi:transcriptional regulator with XRE-family HTH domain
MDDPAEGTGARIRAARQARGLTQEGLARLVGVTRSAVAQWETERSGQVRANLSRIAAALEMPITELLSGERSDPRNPELLGNELALLRLYRRCTEEDKALLLRTAHRLAATRKLEAGELPEDGSSAG